MTTFIYTKIHAALTGASYGAAAALVLTVAMRLIGVL